MTIGFGVPQDWNKSGDEEVVAAPVAASPARRSRRTQRAGSNAEAAAESLMHTLTESDGLSTRIVTLKVHLQVVPAMLANGARGKHSYYERVALRRDLSVDEYHPSIRQR